MADLMKDKRMEIARSAFAPQEGADAPLKKPQERDSFLVRGGKGDRAIKLPRSVYQGPILPPEMTFEDILLQQGYVRRPGEKDFSLPMEGLKPGVLGPPGTRASRKGLDKRAFGLAYPWEGESLPEDISERDKLLEKFPLPSYGEAEKMRAGIDEILNEIVAAKSAEKQAAHEAALREKYGDTLGGALGFVGQRMPDMVSPGRLSAEEEDELFQEAGREYLRRMEARRADMEDTPAG